MDAITNIMTTRKVMVYGKYKNNKRFKAMDIGNGSLVGNLMYATIVSESRLDALKDYVKSMSVALPNMDFEIRYTDNGKVVPFDDGTIIQDIVDEMKPTQTVAMKMCIYDKTRKVWSSCDKDCKTVSFNSKKVARWRYTEDGFKHLKGACDMIVEHIGANKVMCEVRDFDTGEVLYRIG